MYPAGKRLWNNRDPEKKSSWVKTNFRCANPNARCVETVLGNSVIELIIEYEVGAFHITGACEPLEPLRKE